MSVIRNATVPDGSEFTGATIRGGARRPSAVAVSLT
jgi:hypothetical protein